MLLFNYMKTVYRFLFLTFLFTSFTYQSLAIVTTATDKKASKYTCTNLSKVMQFGFKDTKNSNEISKLRNFLKEDGDFASKDNDTLGYFGTSTKIALIAFQKKYKINGTGVVGQLTRAKIKDISCVSVPLATNKKVVTSAVISKIKETATTTVVATIVKETPTIKEMPVIKETPTIFVKTMLASDITSNSASLNGKGGIDGEKHWFEWGKTMGLSNLTSQVISTTTYSAKITGLLPQTIYYFRAVTSVATTTERKGEIAYGAILYFTTPAVSTGATPVVTTVSISSTQIAVNPSGGTKVTWSSTNASICHFTGGEDGGDWTKQTAISGIYITKPILKDSIFGIYCTGPSGYTVTSSVTVSKIVK